MSKYVKVVSNIKRIKEIEDDIQDDLLETLVEESEDRILGFINSKREKKMKDLPEELNYILQDVTVIRFNRMNSEGMKADSEEGQSFTWKDSYLEDHYEVLGSYQDQDEAEKIPRRGNISFF